MQQDPQAAAIPVILVTGHEEMLSQTSEELPPVLIKPFRPLQLLTKVKEQLESRGQGPGVRGQGPVNIDQ
jgi:CheY-like chemotaxis protein